MKNRKSFIKDLQWMAYLLQQKIERLTSAGKDFQRLQREMDALMWAIGQLDVGPGWTLTLASPTDEMVNAGERVLRKKLSKARVRHNLNLQRAATNIYIKMITAGPYPQPSPTAQQYKASDDSEALTVRLEPETDDDEEALVLNRRLSDLADEFSHIKAD